MGSQDANKLVGSYRNPCGACRYLCRRCTGDCVYASNFPADSVEKFSNVMQVFGGETWFAMRLNGLAASERQYLIDHAEHAFHMQQLLRQVEEAYDCLIKARLYALNQMWTMDANDKERQDMLQEFLKHSDGTLQTAQVGKYLLRNLLSYTVHEVNSINHDDMLSEESPNYLRQLTLDWANLAFDMRQKCTALEHELQLLQKQDLKLAEMANSSMLNHREEVELMQRHPKQFSAVVPGKNLTVEVKKEELRAD